MFTGKSSVDKIRKQFETGSAQNLLNSPSTEDIPPLSPVSVRQIFNSGQFWHFLGSFLALFGLFWPKSSSKKCQLFSYIILGETNGEFLSKTNEKSTYKVSPYTFNVLVDDHRDPPQY